MKGVCERDWGNARVCECMYVCMKWLRRMAVMER